MCYEAKSEELKPLHSWECLKYQLQCARECAEDDNGLAFSYTKIENASHHLRFEGQLMTGTICTQSEINHIDARQTYHLKGFFVEGLFSSFGITTVTELDLVLEAENEFSWMVIDHHGRNVEHEYGASNGVISESKTVEKKLIVTRNIANLQI